MNRPLKMFLLTCLAMLAFAANSLLNRVALSDTAIDPASFTLIRLLAGAVFLWFIHAYRPSGERLKRKASVGGNWLSAAALFIYAAGFSFAYLSLTAATGALLLFAAVQITMMAVALSRGERLNAMQILGFTLALTGLVILLLPGVSAPSWQGAVLMLVAGVAWGIYTLRGQGATDPLQTTAGNFVRAVPFALLCWFVWGAAEPDAIGVWYAVLSGGLASGVGYAIWYSVLPSLSAMIAATVQLSVPVLAAVGGVLLLSESVTLRLLVASMAILGGIAIVIGARKTQRQSPDVKSTKAD
ncbi:DMT family transporter [Photobacterium sp. TLY01]|uniref:DMT family transporter n=1 Tax=Photobacterium sp. TLY01 TaxID=2907534 RepID=UPI001F412067|nr:DMT family transporter [Photobacterium sp. TLY01]UIP28563.1 DMT family transporter [Photobacterium sp. TLY01]